MKFGMVSEILSTHPSGKRLLQLATNTCQHAGWLQTEQTYSCIDCFYIFEINDPNQNNGSNFKRKLS